MATNRENGVIDVELEGRIYTFCTDLNALIRLEEMFSTPEREVSWVQIVARADAGSPRHMRAVLWAALQREHPDVTLEEAGRLITLLAARRIQDVMRDASAGARPDPKDVKELGEDAKKQKRPQKAQTGNGGTGETSTSRLAVPA